MFNPFLIGHHLQISTPSKPQQLHKKDLSKFQVRSSSPNSETQEIAMADNVKLGVAIEASVQSFFHPAPQHARPEPLVPPPRERLPHMNAPLATLIIGIAANRRGRIAQNLDLRRANFL